MTSKRTAGMLYAIILGFELRDSEAEKIRNLRVNHRLSMKAIAEKLNLEQIYGIAPTTARAVIDYVVRGYNGNYLSEVPPFDGIIDSEVNKLVKEDLHTHSFKLAQKESLENKRSGVFKLTFAERLKNGKKAIARVYPNRVAYSEKEECIIIKCINQKEKYSLQKGRNKGGYDVRRISKILKRLGFERKAKDITKAIPRIARRIEYINTTTA